MAVNRGHYLLLEVSGDQVPVNLAGPEPSRAAPSRDSRSFIELPGAAALLPRLAGASDAARSRGVRIGYVRLGFDFLTRKTRVGAFSTTDSDQQLRDRKIDTLILAGLTSSEAVLSNVRDAVDRDYHVYTLEDCCSERDQDVHDLLMQKISPRQACVVSIAGPSTRLGAK